MSFDVEAAMPFIGGTLYAALRGGCAPEWEAYVGHRFVRELAAGTLSRAEFVAWMVQDYLYLIHYTRAYALMIAKGGNLELMRGAAVIVHGLLTGEMSLHRRMLEGEGVDVARLDAWPETLETIAYGRYILDRGFAGDVLDLSVTLSACLAGYGEIGLRLKADPATRLDGNPYLDWIETYAGEAYLSLVREGLERLEALSRSLGGAQRFPLLLTEFREAVRLEAAFWDAGRSALAMAG